MIRAFICTWSSEPLPGGFRQIHNPIVDHVVANNISGVTCSMHYADADANGLPDKPRVLVMVEGPAVIETFANLAGVRMLPNVSFNTPADSIPQAIIDEVVAGLVAEGVPSNALNVPVKYGDILRDVARYLSPSHAGFGLYETRDWG